MRFFILLLFLFFNHQLFSCDSVRVAVRIEKQPGMDTVVTHSAESYYWDSTGTTITWQSQDSRKTVTYDSLGRIILTEDYYLDSINFVLQWREERYYTIHNKDSLWLRYLYSSIPPPALFNKKSWVYNTNDSLIYYIEQDVFGDTIKSIHTWYPTGFPDVIRIDSVYGSSHQWEYLHAYTLLGTTIHYRIYDATLYIQPDLSWSDQFYNGYYQCGYLSGSTYYSPFYSRWDSYSFDANCRLLQFSHGSSGANGSRYEINYYYGDCNHMFMLLQADQYKICRNDTTAIHAYVFGGTPPYTYQWSPSGSVMYDTSASTAVFPHDTTSFLMNVTDSLGNVISDTLKINVSYINPPQLALINLDSANGCYSADITYSRTQGAHYTIIRDSLTGFRYYDPPPLHIVYNGLYYLQISSNECPLIIDSIHVNQFIHESPYVEVFDGCNELIATSATATDFNWYSGSPPMLYHQGAVLSFNSSGYYECEAVDSLGCKSEQLNAYAEYFYINANFNLLCNDSCNSSGQVSAYPWFNHIYQYLWSNGDTATFTSTLCDGVASVTVTNEIGCALTAVDDTCTVSVEEINPKEWKVFPVPADHELILETSSTEFPFDISLYDVYGRKIIVSQMNSPRILISLNRVYSGTYFLQINKNYTRQFNRKIIIR